MDDNNLTKTWNFSNAHIDENIGTGDSNNFFSAARCILYATPASKTETNTFQRIGVVQGFTFQEQKQIDPVYEIGSDLPYFVPGRTMGQLQVQRILLSGKDLFNLVYNGNISNNNTGVGPNWIASLKDTRLNIPFDLLFAYYGQVAADGSGNFVESYSRLFKNCYFQSRQEGLAAGQIIVAESVGIVYEYIASCAFM